VSVCLCVLVSGCSSVGLSVPKWMSNDNCRKYQPSFMKFSGNIDFYKDTNPLVFGSDRSPPYPPPRSHSRKIQETYVER